MVDLADITALTNAQIENADEVPLRRPGASPATARTQKTTIAALKQVFGEVPIVEDLQPDPFSFTPVINAALGQLYESEEMTISGITPGATVYIVSIGGPYSKNGGAYTSVQGTGTNGTTIKVRRESSTLNGIQVEVTLSVGGPDNMRSADFRITTVELEPEDGAWAPGPDLVVRDFNHINVATGSVAAWPSAGFWPKTATQAAVALQPVKQAGGGVKFAKGTKQALVWAADSRNTLLDRCGVIIVAADLVNNPNVGQITFGAIDGNGGGVAFRHPQYHLSAIAGVFKAGIRTYHFDDVGTPVIVNHEVAVASGAITTKHLIVWYRRENMMYIRVNGIAGTPVFYGAWLNASEHPSQASALGSNIVNLPADVILYRTMTLQGEHPETWFDKLEGWAQHAMGTVPLPAEHPYHDAPPEGLDADDDPYHWEYDSVAWAAFQAEIGSATDLSTTKYAHRGEAEVAQTGFDLVFFEDFKTDPLVNNYSGPKGASLYVPMNPPTTIHHDAGALPKNSRNYVFDHTGVGTLSLRLVQLNGDPGSPLWTSGSFQSVNTNGVGRSWGGHCLREMRMKMPAMAAPRPGFFPAWWTYNEESYFWQTRPRLEWDWWEADGLDGRYYNQTLHLHEGNIPYDGEEYVPPATRQKLTAYALSVANFGTLIDIYDGEFHLWKQWSDPNTDLTYISVDGLEVVRMPTIPEFLERQVLLVDLAYRSVQGLAIPGATYDMTIDYVKISKLTTELAVWAAPFTARPTLAGTPSPPNSLTLNPRISSSQLQVHWYRSGVPIVASTDDLSYVLTNDDIGFKIRASVRAMDLLNQPEAWTAETATIT